VLYIVLLLVLAALGLLVPALTTSQNLWAWSSVGASGVAAALLVFDWWLRRRSRTVEAVAADTTSTPSEPVDQQVSDDGHEVRAEGSEEEPAPRAAAAAEPSEEDTDAADLLLVADLSDEVRVLDERPRYHLAACTWLASRPSLGLPVKEARQLGFTPCSACRPDSALAGKHRAARA
jgi:hypothetical protein